MWKLLKNFCVMTYRAVRYPYNSNLLDYLIYLFGQLCGLIVFLVYISISVYIIYHLGHAGLMENEDKSDVQAIIESTPELHLDLSGYKGSRYKILYSIYNTIIVHIQCIISNLALPISVLT